ncbi:hypothetical protein [Spirillospora sp. NPDC029432]|uniref:hypothetical protein n=1 Tax=Spirillospora sp. NPDC029432 TaxID=3154599 RepID=UPI0034550E96
MAERTTASSPLAVLGAHLGARGLEVKLTARGLVVANPQVAMDTITCRARADDFGNVWFWTSWNRPIAPADRIAEATQAVIGYLVGR